MSGVSGSEKEWNDKITSEDALWKYNCWDCVRTRECGEVELDLAKQLNLEAVHAAQQEMFWPVLSAMLRGVRIDPTARDKMADEIQDRISLLEGFLREVLGHPININSSKQMIELFYTDLGQPPIMSRAKKGQKPHVTCDDEALTKIGNREPLLKPIVTAIADLRTLNKFLSDFVLMKLDTDGRMRCSFNIGGSESGKSAPKTFRLSSSKSAFDSGGNLQTIPSEKSKSVGKAAARAKENALAMLGDPAQMPNIRSMYVPDPGFTWFDMDLDRADIQVMAWDADDELLKAVCRTGSDIHLVNAYVCNGKEPPPLENLVERHSIDAACTCPPGGCYWDFRVPMKFEREFAKVFAHATDYLGKPRTVAAAVHKTVHETERAQRIYLGKYKGIERWQKRVIEQVQKYRFVENRFGYKWFIFDRLDDSLFPEAVAWIPQSTVSIVINRIWQNIHKNLPEVQTLLQVHDSLCGQGPTHRTASWVAGLAEQAKVVVPYDDPLVIPVGIATSDVSWGACK